MHVHCLKIHKSNDSERPVVGYGTQGVFYTSRCETDLLPIRHHRIRMSPDAVMGNKLTDNADLFGAHNHNHLATFEAGIGFNFSERIEFRFDLDKDLVRNFLVRHFTSTKAHRHFDFVAVL